MLLTLATRSFINVVSSPPTDDESLTAFDLPDYAVNQLQLRGLNVSASMLTGWSLEDLDQLRDRADKAACPCLILVEETPLQLGKDPEQRRAAVDRIHRLAVAGHRLGCNAMSLRFDASDNDEEFEIIVQELRELMPAIERHELNILISPWKGLTHDPVRLTDLLKRIGGFRIGSLPSFAHAAMFDDPRDVLRKLAPYAGAIHATIEGFDKDGNHTGLDLAAGVEAIRSVGFSNTLAIEYVGEGDPTANIEQARIMLEQAIEADLQKGK